MLQTEFHYTPLFIPNNYIFEKFCGLKTAIISLSSKVFGKVSIKRSRLLCKWEENYKDSVTFVLHIIA